MKKLVFICLALFTLNACNDDLTDLNKDIKNPTAVEARTLIANATVDLFDFMSSTNVNRNNLRLWSQHWAQTQYPDESNYELVNRNVNGRTWDRFYSSVIKDVREAKSIIDADEFLSDENRKNQLALIEVMEVLSFHVLVDIFGDVPYTAALGDDVTPAYDTDASIYAALVTRLDAAIGNLGGSNGLGTSDLVYGGDADAWKKMANSLKLRLAIRMAHTDDALAARMAEEAVTSGVFDSSADDFELVYTKETPNTNPLWEDLVQSGRTDFIAANTLVDRMNPLNDPRMPAYFSNPIEVIDSTVMPWDTTLAFVGGTFGTQNTYSSNSHVGDVLLDPEYPGTILDYTEVRFLLADATARGYNVGGTPEAHYDAAITNSIVEWTGDAAAAATYLGQADVAWATAAGDWKAKIGFQKWLAMYNRGFEAWSTYRLYDSPVLPAAADAGIVPPLRYTYPVDEFSLNGESVNAAISAMGGQDDWFHPVFWDKN